MSTASTRSRSRKKRRRSDGAAPKGKAAPPRGNAALLVDPQQSPQGDLQERSWLIGSIAILVAGAVLRLYNLNLVPLHHDEGVNGNFLVRLVREGFYHYDPTNYHGPTLYYFSAIIPWILRFLFGASAQDTYGLNTVTVRLVMSLFGVATIWLVLLLRRRIGTIGSLGAAALLAVSPGAVYLSRYFIHETLFVFFTLAVVVAALKYHDDGHPVYLILTSASAALFFATKETFIINAPVLLMALACTAFYTWLRTPSYQPRSRSKKRRGETKDQDERLQDNVSRLGGPRKLAILGVLAVGIFVLVSVAFYSSFFTNSKGVYDSLKTFQVWTQTGQKAHVHPFWKYIEWLVLQEGPLLLLGTIGAAITLWRPRNSFALFAAFWAFGILAAYSMVPYKTPWLALNFIVPLSLVSGFALQAVYDHGGRESLLVIVVALVMALSVSSYQTIDLNFFRYDDDQKTVHLEFIKAELNPQYYVYVYAHTRRETLNLVDEINRMTQISGDGNRMGITIVSPDYWPLPWYLRDYTRVGYHGRMTTSNEPVVVAAESQGAEVQATFGDRYEQVNSGFNPAGSYPLRPGVSLLLYVKRGLVRR